MRTRVLITGGAGFIGRHVCKALLKTGYAVRVLDRLIDQVHGTDGRPDIPDDAELIIGDVRDAERVASALTGVEHVIHLAAEVGVGQSMYEIDRYVSANDLGTAVLLQVLSSSPVRRLVVASSMSIYGEGLYHDAQGRVVEDAVRSRTDQALGWDPMDAEGAPLRPIPTPEWKRPALASVYAVTKYTQERLVLAVGPAYGIESVALRLFNVYGPGQALSNPYTGVLAIFASRLLNGERPMVFEDGAQQRDFVHVTDVADAFVQALEAPGVAGGVFNIGSGNSVTISALANQLASALECGAVQPEILRQARVGDIRHCLADISLARATLGFVPRRSLQEGLAALAEWLRDQRPTDRVPQARRELEMRGLVA